MLCPSLVAQSSLFAPPKLRTSTLICLCALQDNFHMQVLFWSAVGEISFRAFFFQLQILFYLLVQTYEIRHTSNQSEYEIKFWNINWCNFRGYLVSWGGSSSANFNFYNHWNLSKDIKSPIYKSKIITFHLGLSYC